MSRILLLLVIADAETCRPTICPVVRQGGNGQCDVGCMTLRCGFDGGKESGDCADACTLVCPLGKQGDGVCDAECSVAVCGWDFGDCGVCSPGCNSHPGSSGLLENEDCDSSCNVPSCDFDSGRCISEANPDTVYVGGVRGTLPWAESLETATNSLWAPFTTIYLLAGQHSLSGPLRIATGVVVLSTVLCSQSSIPGCAIEPATIQLENVHATIFVETQLRIIGVDIRGGFALKSGCAMCNYCPAVSYDPLSASYVNDRGESVSDFAEQELCQSSVSLFQSMPGSLLSLQYVVVSSVLHQPPSLIDSRGDLVLVSVTFHNIIPRSAMITVKGVLEYRGGTVSLLNNGYELFQSPSAGFLAAESAAGVALQDVEFQYSQAKVWIDSGPAQLQLQNCTFSALVSEVLIRASRAEIIGCTFLDNFLSAIAVELYLSDSLQMSDCAFENNVAQGLIAVTALDAAKVDFSLTHLYLKRNIFSTAVAVSSLNVVVIRECIFEENGDVSSINALSPLQVFLSNPALYAEVLPSLGKVTCSEVLSVTACSSMELWAVTLSSSVCAARSFHVSDTPSILIESLIVADNIGGELLVLYNSSQAALLNAVFRNNSNLSSRVPTCMNIKEGDTVLITNSTFVGNAGVRASAGQIAEVRALSLSEVRVYDNTAVSNTAGLFFEPSVSADSALSLRSCLFRNNSAFFDGALTIESEEAHLFVLSTLTLTVLDSVFSLNTAQLTGASVTLVSVALSNRSTISNCSFVQNVCGEGGCAFYLDLESGRLRIEASTFVSSSGRMGSAMIFAYDSSKGSAEVAISHSEFSQNSGSSIIALMGLGMPTLLTQNCTFRYNSASALYLLSGQVIDSDSRFYRNTAENGSVLNVGGTAVSVFLRSQMTDNSVSGRGGAVYLSSNSNFACDQCAFANNSCQLLGGVIYLYHSCVLQVRNCTFLRNFSKTHASVIYSHTSTLTLQSTAFIGNAAGGFGTLVFYDSVFTLIDCEIRENIAAAKTPGIVGRYSTGSVTRTKFLSQKGTAGAFFFVTDLMNLAVSQSVFRNCSANTGGALVMAVVTTVTMTDTVISDCSSATDGGVVSCRISTLKLTNVQISNAKSPESTGALFFLQSTFYAVDSTFTDLVGSVVYAEGSTISIDRSDFARIRTIYGAGVDCVDCNALNVSNSRFRDGVTRKGGAVYAFTSGGAVTERLCIYENNTFANNTAVNGGAIYSDSYFIIAKNNVFVNNSARAGSYSQGELVEKGVGGAVFALCGFLPYCSFQYLSNSFLNNFAEVQGGAIRWYNTFPTVLNSTFDGNAALYGSDIASFAVRLALVSDNDTILPYFDNLTDAPVVATLEEVASGQIYSGVIRVALIDQYDSIVRIDSSSAAHIKTDNTSNVSVYGNIQVVAERGIFVFSNFTMSGTPNSTQTFLISTDGVDTDLKTFTNDPSAYFETVRVVLHFRECLVGENEQFDECKPCPVNTFSLHPSQLCTSCPAHAKCYGTYQMVPEKGYWRPDPYRNLFFECPNTVACLGSPDPKNLSLTGECATGYRGNLCSVCLKGYSKQSGQVCSSCPSFASNVGLSAVMLIFVLCVLTLLVAISIRSATRPRSELATYAKIFLNYLQMIVVAGSIRVSWPRFVSEFLRLQSMAGSASEQLLSFDCLLEEMSRQEVYFTNVQIYVVLPAGLLLAALLLWLLLRAFLRVTHVLQKTTATLVMVLFILHTSLTKLLFSVFACMELLPGEFWLSNDLSIKCWNSTHIKHVLTLAVPGICVWVLGLPTVCLIILIGSRRQLHSLQTKLKFGFLYKGFHTEWFFWEFVILYRKVLLVSVSVFLTTQARMVQALSVLALLLVSVFLQLYISPYNAATFNRLEAKSIFASMITIYSGLFYETGATEASVNIVIFVAILLANAYFIASWVLLVLPLLVSTLRLWCGRFQSPTRIHPKSNMGDLTAARSATPTQKGTPDRSADIESYLAPENSFVGLEDMRRQDFR